MFCVTFKYLCFLISYEEIINAICQCQLYQSSTFTAGNFEYQPLEIPPVQFLLNSTKLKTMHVQKEISRQHL